MGRGLFVTKSTETIVVPHDKDAKQVHLQASNKQRHSQAYSMYITQETLCVSLQNVQQNVIVNRPSLQLQNEYVD